VIARTHDPFRRSVASAVVLILALFAGSAVAQSLAQQLVGTWKITSGVMQVGDETKLTPLGANIVGMMMYTPEGHFCFTAMSANRPKLARG